MTDLRTAALRALASLKGYRRELGCQQPCDAERALEAVLAQPEDKSQAAFEHWVETVEATQGCAISRNAVADELLTVTPAQRAHAEAMEPATINHDYERGFVDGMSEQAKRSVDRVVNRMADALEQPVAWVITDENINSLQVASIQRLIDRLKHAHHTDLRVRINGQDEWFQADWIKHLQRTHPSRPWHGFTDEERDYFKACGFVGVSRVEEKLRAKNSTLVPKN